jgi:4-hydroxythreonine-4-phosphate dehydrogenase
MKSNAILIVAGEPNSVFLEIFFKSFKVKKYTSPIVIIASKNLLVKQMKFLGFNHQINLISKDCKKLDNKKINLIDVNYNFKKSFDNITKNSNSYITECFNIALGILKKKNIYKFINGPISKKHFLQGRFLGITEYLAERTKRKNKVAMMIFNKQLSVSPITTHLPIKNIHKNLSKQKIYNHVKLITEFYKMRFKKLPKIAITGLNPHCESNFKNSEEDSIIKPAIKNLIKKRYMVKGPFAADTIFLKEQSKKYDIIIGMYHDQVLAPLKSLFGFNAINITLGLPFIRVTPDHGPNHSMLGKNLSSPESLIEALKFLDK